MKTFPLCWLREGGRLINGGVFLLDPRPKLREVLPLHGRRFLLIYFHPCPKYTVIAVPAHHGGCPDGCACAILLVVVKGEVGGGGDGGGGGGDSSSAVRC